MKFRTEISKGPIKVGQIRICKWRAKHVDTWSINGKVRVIGIRTSAICEIWVKVQILQKNHPKYKYIVEYPKDSFLK